MINAGDLRHRVDHQTRSASRDSFGQEVETWTTEGTYWAFVQPLQGRELVNAQQLRADVSHKVKLRWLGAIVVSPKDRFLYKTRILNIEAVLNIDERNHTYECLCTEVVS